MKHSLWKRSVVLMVVLSMLWASSPMAFVYAEEDVTVQNDSLDEGSTESDTAPSDEETEEDDQETEEEVVEEDADEVADDPSIDEEIAEEMEPEEDIPEEMTEEEANDIKPESMITASSTTYENTSTSTPPTEEVYTATSTASDTATTTASTTITTGTAVALANTLNLVNANFINSSGIVLFENFFDTLMEDFDLRDLYNSATSYGCSLSSCTTDGVRTNIENDAIIENELYVEAISGGNTIENGGDATIETGDAYAGVNLINIANTNVIDSNYLLLTMNAFQNVDGDIVFPSLSTFFSRLAGGSPNKIDITNAADIANNVTLDANTGDNETDDATSSIIRTGDSAASTNVFNQLNTTLGGGQSLSIIFRVHGSWAGEIFGAPSNLSWMDDGSGGIYIFDNQGSGGSGSAEISATNTASITNNVQVVALTGENAISGSETALISTGNAYAGANIMNVANATVIGRNWMLAIINIFGDFNGNIAFGRPDLWIGGQAEVPNKIRNGSEIEYTLTVINNGDSPATKVVLSNTYDAHHLDITNASIPFERDDDNTIIWNIPDLEAGEATEITYRGVVRDAGYNTDIDSVVSVSERETDHNDSDNADIITITTSSRPPKKDPIRIEPAPDDEMDPPVMDEGALSTAISVKRMSASTTVNIGTREQSEQHLIVTNTSDRELRNVVFHDFVLDPDGKILHEDIWDLGTMQPREEIEIRYAIDLGMDATEGLYLLSTRMDWEGRYRIFGKNGTIHAWRELARADENELTSLTTTEETSTSTAPLWNVFLPNVAEAAVIEGSTASSGDLFDRFGIRGTLLLLASLMILYGWHRRDWYPQIKRRLILFGWRGRVGNMKHWG